MLGSGQDVVTILGSGVMGNGIAAVLANNSLEAGIRKIFLLDLKSLEGNPNTLAQKGLNRIKRDNRMHLALPEYADRIRLGNFDDDLAASLSISDWVVEAIVEDEQLKRDLYRRVVPHLPEEAILSTNTSGIPINRLTEGLNEAVRRRFLVTHFFNPPRHMKLLELVPGDETDRSVLRLMEEYGSKALGKGVVIGRDTPGFVSNRVGVQQLNQLILMAEEYGPELLDCIFGKHLWGVGGKPFVTCEKIGIDTLRDVGNDLASRTNDRNPSISPIPGFIEKMIEAGLLGEKSAQKRGFYGNKGKEVYNIRTGSYEPAKRYGKGGPAIDSVERAQRAASPSEAVKIMFGAHDQGGKIWRAVELSNIAYALQRSGEICRSVRDIDCAIRWGWNRALGPGQIADSAGFALVVEACLKEGLGIPSWAQQLAEKGGSLYRFDQAGARSCFDAASGEYLSDPDRSRESSFLEIVRKSGTLFEIPKAVRVFDLNDEPPVLGIEIASKKGTVSMEVIEGIHTALDLAQQQPGYRGCVIANPKDADFSLGADLFVLVGLGYRATSQGEAWAKEALIRMSKRFQELNQRIIYHPVPVVVAKHGTAVGGGAELGFGGHIRAATELYTGLVEFAVGIAPGGGGLKNLLFNRYDMRRAQGRIEADPMTYAMDTLETLAWNWLRVSISADDAKRRGYLKMEDRISRNPDDLIRDAVKDVLRLSQDYHPPLHERRIALPGREGYAAMMNYGEWAAESNWIAHEHVPQVMQELALALSSGPDGAEIVVTEQEVLDRERTATVRLAMSEHAWRLAARVLHMDYGKKFLERALNATQPEGILVGETKK